MKTVQELRAEWKGSAAQAQWATVLQSAAWRVVSELMRAEMMQSGTPASVNEPDDVLARRLTRQNGGLAMLTKLQEASNPDPEPYQDLPDPWEYVKLPGEDHATNIKTTKRK